MKKVLIYRSRLLPRSETFVRDHYDSLTRYEPHFCGLRRVDELDISDTRHLLLEQYGRSSLGLGLFKAFGFGQGFIDRIRAIQPDLVHCHFAVDAVDMLPVVRRLGVPLVVTLHGYDVTFTNAAFRQMGAEGVNYLVKRKTLFQRADLFLPVSKFIEGKAIEAGAPAGRTRLHYLGLDLRKFVHTVGQRDNAVLYVGRLVEKKGLNLLIDAMVQAGANESGTVLRIIGDGPKRADFLALAQQKLRHVDYLGAQPHGRVIEELRHASVFSVPSMPSQSGDNEGLPIACMEACAMQVPVVSFAQGGILEAVKDGETGLLAPAGDVGALALRLRRLIADPALGVRLGAAGRRHVEDVFDITARASRLETLYDDLLARSQRPRKAT